jgi:hypothetical protein
MKFIYKLILFTILSSCTKGQELELEIITKEINSLKIKSENYDNLMTNVDSIYSERFNKAKTIIVYKLKNYSSKTYFFNIEAFEKKLSELNSIKIDKAYLNIIDSKENIIKVNKSISSRFLSSEEIRFELMNYDFKYYHKNRNFIIHPNETLYFEWFIVLPFGTIIEQPVSFVNLDPNKKYEVELQMTSYNSNEAQKYLSRTELETIRENGYEIFDGTITSKNRIPIKFIK